jgi:GNAT superfamily N-acetyltransferase
MWCELQGVKQVGKLGDGVRIRVEGEKDDSAISHPVGEKRVWNVSALRGEGWLGGCTLQVTTGEHGVGGLFDMYVKPEEQRQGIGTALTQATCELAMKLGCHHVVLNATEEGGPVYQRVGFQSLGMGRTWFLRDSVFDLPPPSPGQVRFLEAVGKGDISALDAMKDGLLPEQLSGETINGETPLEIAVRCKQKGSVEWLVEHGVVPDIMSLWDLGWKDRIPALLATHPELVRRKSGRWTATSGMMWIWRNCC